MIDLKSVVEKYPECLDSATKFKSYMMDLYPDSSNKARIRILADIVDCGIALEIKNGKTDSISISNFCNTMENQYGYSLKLVEECVNQFLVAFGFNFNNLSSATPKKNSAIVHSSSKESKKTLVQTTAPSFVCNIDDFNIENNVLKNYVGASNKVYIPEFITEIGKDAFKNCKNILEIYIPDGVLKIEKGAFYGCTSLVSINIPKRITKISPWLFTNCKNLKQVIIPENVTEIGAWSFARCKNLIDVNIPNNVIKIGGSAFSDCSLLNEVEIPLKVKHFGIEPFIYCSNLKTVYFHSEEQKNKFASCFAPNVKLIVKAK